MTGTSPAAFWSYAHRDDEQDDGRILRLAKRIEDEFSLLTGSDLNIYVDRNDNRWGQVWRERIDSALQDTTFFIPIITPRYFTRPECRGELMKFAAAARSLGVVELILPIRYSVVRDFTESNTDDAIALVSQMQYADWRELRLSDEQSEGYRRAINELSTRLAELSESVGSRPAALPATSGHGTTPGPVDDPGSSDLYEDPDAPGLFDLLADFEPAMDRVAAVLREVPEIMRSFTSPTEDATAGLKEVNRQKKPFAARIVIFRKLAEELDSPSREMESVGKRYTAELLAADPAVRAFIAVGKDLSASVEDEASRQSGQGALDSVRGAVQASRENLQAMQRLANTVRKNVRMSRDLRPAMLRIETGLRGLIDAQAILEDWDRLLGDDEDNSSAIR